MFRKTPGAARRFFLRREAHFLIREKGFPQKKVFFRGFPIDLTEKWIKLRENFRSGEILPAEKFGK